MTDLHAWGPGRRWHRGGRDSMLRRARYLHATDFTAKGVKTAVRFSPHYYNTEEEIDAVGAALA